MVQAPNILPFRCAAAVGVAFVCGMTATGAVQAQEAASAPPATAAPSGEGVIPFPAAFFMALKPVSAFDMIQRLPGFTFQAGADVRGFNGAAGNVLIDGERPSSKSVTLDQALQRIQASQVERIDLVRGGAPGIDMQGQPVVANVIRRKGATATVTAQALAKTFADGFTGWVPRLEGAWRSGPLSLEGVLAYRYDHTNASGDGPFERFDALGRRTQWGIFVADERQKLTNVNLAAEYNRGVDILRFNLAGAREKIKRRERSDLADALGSFVTLNDSFRHSDDWEVGGDYQRPLSSILTARVVGLATLSTDEIGGASRGRATLQDSTGSSEAGERIFRGSLIATPRDSLRLEGGAEAAFNYLDSKSTLTQNGVPVILPSANVRVEEQRAEAFATAVWRPAEALSVEGGMRYEQSTISQSGGSNLEKTLAFAKPRLIVSWAPSGASQVRMRISREVGQLTFTDFAANAELDTGTHNAGNADLEPERSWVAEGAYERRFWGNGAVVLTLSRAEIESAVDLIPINNRYDAPGNIGDGWRQTAKLNLTVPFANLGLRGATLKFNGTWIRSEVTDPVTGLKRRISDDRPFASDWMFTKSFPTLNSVFTMEGVSMDNQRTAYRISEVRTIADDAYVRVYWDWTPRQWLTMRFWLENAVSQSQVRKRLLYDGSRNGPLTVYERREKGLDPWFVWRVRATF
jgi:hypothetical protein